MSRKGLFNRIATKASNMSLITLAGMYILAYLAVEIVVVNPIRLYNFCVFLSLSGIYFSWLMGGRKTLVYVTFFNLFFVAVFSKMLWDHGIIIYGGRLFLAKSFLMLYAFSLGLLLIMLLKKSPADVRLETQKKAVEDARQRQQNLEFMVASRKLKKDLIAQANIVKDELQLLEGAWKSNIHDIINDLPSVKERELYEQIILPFEENIIGHLRNLELRLTFDLETVTLSELYEFISWNLDTSIKRNSGSIEISDQDWKDNPSRVVVDRNKVWDMVLNAVRNSQAALDYKRIEMLRSGETHAFTPQVRLTFTCSGPRARLKIIDNGGGVQSSLIGRLYQEPVPSRKRGGEKPGQGTLFVKFFGERMGINVHAENTRVLDDEAGLEVTFSIPCSFAQSA